MRERAIRILDSYTSLLVLLLANFFLLELVHDERWAVIGSTLLGAAALVVAISDPDTGHKLERRHWITIAVCVLVAPVVLFVNSNQAIGLAYLLPAALLVTATLPVTLVRALHLRAARPSVRVRIPGARPRPRRALLRAAGAARGLGVPVLQLRHAHDARLRRP